MTNQKLRDQAGFTVIETLIVLGIAGLIFMIILLAIPALIRNSHNGQRKQDVAAVLSAISHYQLNNSGTFPSTPPPPSGYNYLQYTKLSFYENSEVRLRPQIANIDTLPAPAEITPNDIGVQIFNFALCNTEGNGATGVGAGYRDIAALYKIETSKAYSLRCQQL
ncbi:MAG: hypothetical protein AAB436_00645 [Patescibacteria group bacterium]